MSSKKISRKKSANGRIIVLLVLFSAAWGGWRIREHGALLDESAICGNLENKVNRILARYGVREQDVVRVTRIEKKSEIPYLYSWVETNLDLVLDSRERDKALLDDLKTAAEENKLEVHSKRESPDKIRVSIGKNQRIYQNILLISKPRAPQPIKKILRSYKMKSS